MKFLLLLAWSLCNITLLAPAQAQFDDSGFKQGLKLKKDAYLSEGSFTGGDGANTNFHVSQVRVAANPAGYDRLVIEVQSGIARPPFYLVENDQSNKRVSVTLYGDAKLDFSSQSAIQQAKKTRTISQIDFLPLLGSERFSFVIRTQMPVKTEVFELSGPNRIIIDLKP